MPSARATSREVADKGAAFSQAAQDFQPALMAQQYVLDDGQSQSSSSSIGAATGVNAVETLG